MTPQEKLLEYSLFSLTNNGAAATLTPATQDFGSIAVGFSSAPFTFKWVNNSTFSAGVTSLTATGDFTVTGNNCTTVAAGGSCSITVIFTPTALGARHRRPHRRLPWLHPPRHPHRHRRSPRRLFNQQP